MIEQIPEVIPPAVAATAPMASSVNQLLIMVMTLAGTIITTAAMLWKTSRDQSFALAKTEQEQKHTRELLRLQGEVDAADRREKAATLEAKAERQASEVRERLLSEAQQVRNALDVTAGRLGKRVEEGRTELHHRTESLQTELERVVAHAKREAADELKSQTITLEEAIEQAKEFTANKADAAYLEANGLNRKLEEANARIENLYRIIQQLLAVERPRGPDRRKPPEGHPVVLMPVPPLPQPSENHG